MIWIPFNSLSLSSVCLRLTGITATQIFIYGLFWTINLRLMPNKKALNSYIYLHFATQADQRCAALWTFSHTHKPLFLIKAEAHISHENVVE